MLLFLANLLVCILIALLLTQTQPSLLIQFGHIQTGSLFMSHHIILAILDDIFHYQAFNYIDQNKASVATAKWECFKINHRIYNKLSIDFDNQNSFKRNDKTVSVTIYIYLCIIGTHPFNI